MMSMILSLGRGEIVAFTSGSQRCHIASWQSQVESANDDDMRFARANNKNALSLNRPSITATALPIANVGFQGP